MTDWNAIFEETAAETARQNDAIEADPRTAIRRKERAEALERQIAREIADGIRRIDGTLIEEDEDEEEDIEEFLDEIGYVRQLTPAGRTIWSNPKFILTDAELAEEDDLADDGWL